MRKGEGHHRSVVVPAKFHEKQVVAVGSPGIPNFVGEIGRRLRSKFYGGSRREVSGAVIAGKPIRSQRYPLPGRLLHSELASCLVAHRDDMSSEVKCAECQAGVTLQRFGKFGIYVITRIIAPVLHGNEE